MTGKGAARFTGDDEHEGAVYRKASENHLIPWRSVFVFLPIMVIKYHKYEGILFIFKRLTEALSGFTGSTLALIVVAAMNFRYIT